MGRMCVCVHACVCVCVTDFRGACARHVCILAQIWSIWDGAKWLADAHIKCTGEGARELHVGNPHQPVEGNADAAALLCQLSFVGSLSAVPLNPVVCAPVTTPLFVYRVLSHVCLLGWAYR